MSLLITDVKILAMSNTTNYKPPHLIVVTVTFAFYLEIDNMKVILPSHTYCYLYTNT